MSGIRGLKEVQALFDALPEAARSELGTLLQEIADEAYAAQLAQVPSATGALRAGLKEDVQVELLRARIGLIGLKGGRTDLFYGRPVNSGVRQQTVTVQRRRRVNGQLRTQSRGSRKRVADIVATYSLHVKQRTGVHFIEQPAVFDAAEAKIGAFWDAVEARAGG